LETKRQGILTAVVVSLVDVGASRIMKMSTDLGTLKIALSDRLVGCKSFGLLVVGIISM
jgi:hypothetical protein